MDRTREALIQAGLDLFAEQGLDAPSLDVICERAGFTRGAFYVHFEDRDTFIDAVMERVGIPLLDEVLGSDEDGAPKDMAETAARFLSAVASGAYPLTRKHGPKPHQLLDACARSEKVRARYVSLIELSVRRLTAILDRSQAAGLVRSDVPADAVAWIALAAIVGAQSLLELRALKDMSPAATAFLTLVTSAGAPAPTTEQPTAADLLSSYAVLHARLVKGASPAAAKALADLFAEDAELIVEPSPFGPIRGRSAIEAAFVVTPPAASFKLGDIIARGKSRARAPFTAGKARGELELRAEAGRILALVISPLP